MKTIVYISRAPSFPQGASSRYHPSFRVPLNARSNRARDAFYTVWPRLYLKPPITLWVHRLAALSHHFRNQYMLISIRDNRRCRENMLFFKSIRKPVAKRVESNYHHHRWWFVYVAGRARDINKTNTCARICCLTPLAEPVVFLCKTPVRVDYNLPAC